MSDLDLTLSRILSDNTGMSVVEKNQMFSEYWGSLTPEKQEEYRVILETRAEMIAHLDTFGESFVEKLPWNLQPNDDEINSILSTWFPENMNKNQFARECIRWKVVTSQSFVDGQSILGGRRTQIHEFANMMLRRFPSIGGLGIEIDVEKILSDMVNEGHFYQFEYGLILPNLFSVKISEAQTVLISGWPYRMLERENYVLTCLTNSGLYVYESCEEIPEMTLSDYVKGLDPVKSLSSDAESYIKIQYEIAESNSFEADFPRFSDLLPPPSGSKLALADVNIETHKSMLVWDVAGIKFYVTSLTFHDGQRFPPTIWIPEEYEFNQFEGIHWKKAKLLIGAIKQLQLAYLKLKDRPESLSSCQYETSEIVRMSILMRDLDIERNIIREFCQVNWLVE